MLSRFRTAIQEQTFHPNVLGAFVNPFYFIRRGLHEHIVALAPTLHGRLLDVGCGTKPYQRYFNTSAYIGLELEGRNRHADTYYDGKVFPFKCAEFDSVFTSEVLEHVFNPDEFLSEISRVLKEGGMLLLTVPFIWEEHEQPFDYGRYSSFGLRHLLDCHGFEIIEHRKSMDDVRAVFQVINLYIHKAVRRKGRLNLMFVLLLTAPFNILGELMSWILPRNGSLYLSNIVLAKKRTALP